MNTLLKSLLGAVLLGSFVSTFAADDMMNPSTAELGTLSADVSSLRAKVEKTRNLIERADDKSYRDPKGQKRAHWRRLLGHYQRQIDSTEERIASQSGRPVPDIGG